ncbi:MAG: hypothetical protein GX639_02525 [Fibrobacter sp.]|nr:hypothetical protein [Fibrobacter sp.]
MIKKVYRCIAVIIGLNAFSFAGMPFSVDDAGTVEQGNFEIESAVSFWKEYGEAGLGVKHGLTEKMDIGAGFGYTFAPEDAASMSSLGLSLKFVAIEDHLALSLAGTLGETAYAANVILSHSVKSIGFNANLGFEAEGGIDSALMTFGVSTLYESDRFITGFEIAGNHDELNWWQIGVAVQIVDWTVIAVGLGGNFQNIDALVVTSGITISF